VGRFLAVLGIAFSSQLGTGLVAVTTTPAAAAAGAFAFTSGCCVGAGCRVVEADGSIWRCLVHLSQRCDRGGWPILTILTWATSAFARAWFTRLARFADFTGFAWFATRRALGARCSAAVAGFRLVAVATARSAL
jgi:hypothetical protein